MELDQLRQLVAIEQEGTITAAAASLHLTQPSLSRSMQRLERDLGCELFDHKGNRVDLNEAGRLALAHAHDILNAERAMREAFDSLSRRQRTLVIRSVAPAPLWRLAARVVERAPGTIIEPFLCTEREVADTLAHGRADLGVTRHALHEPGLLSFPLMTEALSFSVPASNPLAKQDKAAFADADGEPLLVLAQVGFWMELVKREMPHSQVIMQEDRNVFLRLLASTDLLAFTTDVPENKRSDPGRITIPISDPSARQTFFASTKADAPTTILSVVTGQDPTNGHDWCP